jgi:hypothetical protein
MKLRGAVQRTALWLPPFYLIYIFICLIFSMFLSQKPGVAFQKPAIILKGLSNVKRKKQLVQA